MTVKPSENILDLRCLRATVKPLFDAYDKSLVLGCEQAKRARSSITAEARFQLNAISASRTTGVYIFLNRDVESGLRGINYIGCAAKQSMMARVKSYLIDDISSLDDEMLRRAPEDARRIADERMRLTMPGTSPELRARYVDGHMRSVAIASGGSLLLAACPAESALIEAAEGMIIAVAWTGGAPLINAGIRLPNPSQREDAYLLARKIVGTWEHSGLPSEVANELVSRLGSVAAMWESLRTDNFDGGVR